jgi:hypothetical protein
MVHSTITYVQGGFDVPVPRARLSEVIEGFGNCIGLGKKENRIDQTKTPEVGSTSKQAVEMTQRAGNIPGPHRQRRRRSASSLAPACTHRRDAAAPPHETAGPCRRHRQLTWSRTRSSTKRPRPVVASDRASARGVAACLRFYHDRAGHDERIRNTQKLANSLPGCRR